MISLIQLLREIRLFEKNKTVDFFRKNPNLLKQFAVPDRGNGEFDAADFYRDSSPGRTDSSIGAIALAMLEKAFPNNDTVKMLAPKEWDYEGIKLIAKFPTYQELLDNRKNYLPRNEQGQEWMDYADHEFMSANYNKIRRISRSAIAKSQGLRDIRKKRYIKAMYKLGLDPDDVSAAMAWVDYYVSASYRKLPADVFKTLQQLSVDPNRLPKYIYRGLFYDGAKIKDQEKFLSKWKEGSMPKEALRKATSFSGDKGTAASFMINQDKVKDAKSGYHILLKWKVRPEDVVADLRNLPVDNRFWNQHEFIVHPDVKDYVVDKLIPYGESTDSTPYSELPYPKYQDTIKGGAGAAGLSKSNTLRSFLLSPYDKYSTNEKIAYKQLYDMTVQEAQKEYAMFNEYYGEVFQAIKNVVLPVYVVGNALVFRGGRKDFTFVKRSTGSTRNTLEFQIFLELDYYSSDNSTELFGSEVTAMLQRNYIDSGKFKTMRDVFNALEYSIKQPTGYGSLTLRPGGGYYSMKFDLELPKSFILDNIPSDYYKADGIPIWEDIMKIFDGKMIANRCREIVSRNLKRLPPTVKISIK
jgi:hypothetical protein